MNINKINKVIYKLPAISTSTSLELHFGDSISNQHYNTLKNIFTNNTTLMYLIDRIVYDDSIEDEGIINNITKEDIYEYNNNPDYDITTQIPIYSKYKQIDVLVKEEIATKRNLLLLEETELDSELTELYENDFLSIKETYRTVSYVIILEPGVQGYLSHIIYDPLTINSKTKTKKNTIEDDIFNLDITSKSNKHNKHDKHNKHNKHNKHDNHNKHDKHDKMNENEKYSFVIEFNTNILQKQKSNDKQNIKLLIEKYTKKINFYLNLDFILKRIIQTAFNVKHVGMINQLNRVLNKPSTLVASDLPRIAMNYTVTDKADGERHLLIIDKYCTGYFINNRLEITGIIDGIFHAKLANTILDGEYLIDSDTSNFLIFDIIQFSGKSIIKSTFVDRLLYLNKVVDKSGFNTNKKWKLLYNTTKHSLNIHVKDFYIIKEDMIAGYDKSVIMDIMTAKFTTVIPRNKFITTVIDLWNSRLEKFDYLLDGLILTPLNGLYTSSSGPAIFKWKDKHTIDVRIMNKKNDDTIWLFDVATRSDEKDIISDYQYDEKQDLTNELGIAEGDIVEFIWNKEQNQFTPIRIRYDKIKPNARRTVEGVIKALNDNITVDKLFNININEQFNFGDIYYQEGNVKYKEREMSLDIALKKYHNYIKEKIIQYPTSHTLTPIFKDNKKDNNKVRGPLLDLSAGKGGDIHKWVKAGYKHVVACDISATALQEFNKRIKKVINSSKDKDISITLFNTDSTRELINGKAGMNEVESKRLINYFTYQHPGLKFSKIICNFSISYMFSKDDPYAGGFFNNVASLLMNINEYGENGYFVGTIIDGDLLDEVFIKQGNTEIVAKVNGETFYIIKPVDGYKAGSINNKIIVSRPGRGGWANAIPEPVIYPAQIKKGANLVGLNKCIFTGFEEYYDDYLYEKKGNRIKLSTGEKEISFLHKTFIITWN